MFETIFTSKWWLPIFISIVAFFAPVHLMMGVVGGLLLMDFITGIWASVTRGDPISSRRMGRTVAKAIMYQIAVITGFLLETALGGLIPVSKLVLGCIALVEGASLFENLNTISGTNLFKVVLDKISAQKEK